MKPSLTQEMNIPSSRCDYSGRLGISDCVDLFLDIAAAHAHDLGMSEDAMAEKHCFWVCAKTRIHFYQMPKIMEKAILMTWPENTERFSANRDYELTAEDGTVMAAGKTQWAVVSTETGKLVQTDTVFPAGLQYIEKRSCPEPFARIRDRFDEEAFASYRVKSTDIDINHHMNNARYFTAIFSLFSIEEIEAMNIKVMEVQYKNPCFEGDVLHFFKHETDDGGTEYKAALSDGKIIAFFRVN